MKIVGKQGYEKVTVTPGYENYREHWNMKIIRNTKIGKCTGYTGIEKSGYEEGTGDTGLIGGTKYRTYYLGKL